MEILKYGVDRYTIDCGKCGSTILFTRFDELVDAYVNNIGDYAKKYIKCPLCNFPNITQLEQWCDYSGKKVTEIDNRKKYED